MTTFSKFNFDKTLESQYLHFISKRKISFVKLLAFTHLKEENVKTVIKVQTINKGTTKTNILSLYASTRRFKAIVT